jgi:hypothetical protein
MQMVTETQSSFAIAERALLKKQARFIGLDLRRFNLKGNGER